MFLEDAIVSNLTQPTPNISDNGKPGGPLFEQAGTRSSAPPSHRDDSLRGYSLRTQQNAHCDLDISLGDVAVSQFLCG
jgi:hypothetical protein